MTKQEYFECIEDGITQIEQYISRNTASGGNYGEWYVGVTNDYERRVYNEHNVSKNGTAIILETEHKAVAEGIEIYFTELRRTKGGPGRAQNDSIYVYAYKITNFTIE